MRFNLQTEEKSAAFESVYLGREAQIEPPAITRQPESEIFHRKARNILEHTSTEVAIRHEDEIVRSLAASTVQNFVGALERIAYKKHKVEETIRQLRMEMEEASRRSRLSRFIQVMGAGGLIVLFLDNPDWHKTYFWGALCLLLGLIASNQVLKVQTEAVSILSEAWDPKAIGVLALGMLTGDRGLKAASRNALLKLLPKAKASDAAFYDEEQMRALSTLLETVSHRQDTPFLIALLKAFEQIGDAKALDGVHNLTLSKNSQVREAAEACLPALQQRVATQKRNNSLLRPALSLENPVENQELLRPVNLSNQDSIPVEELLRPTSRKESDSPTENERLRS